MHVLEPEYGWKVLSRKGDKLRKEVYELSQVHVVIYWMSLDPSRMVQNMSKSNLPKTVISFFYPRLTICLLEDIVGPVSKSWAFHRRQETDRRSEYKPLVFRAGIEFRGLDIQSILGEPWVRLISVNAVGDLFSSTLNLEDTEVRNIYLYIRGQNFWFGNPLRNH